MQLFTILKNVRGARIDLKVGDLLAIDTVGGINTIVWSLSKENDLDVDAVDSLEQGDLCLCIDPDPFFKGYVIVATQNGVMGYVCDSHVALVNSLKVSVRDVP